MDQSDRSVGVDYLARERSERAQSCPCSIENSDTYVYIYEAVRQVLCACSVVRNVGGVNC